MDEFEMQIKEACIKVSEQLIEEFDSGGKDVVLSERFYQKMKEDFPFLHDKIHQQKTNIKKYIK